MGRVPTLLQPTPTLLLTSLLIRAHDLLMTFLSLGCFPILSMGALGGIYRRNEASTRASPQGSPEDLRLSPRSVEGVCFPGRPTWLKAPDPPASTTSPLLRVLRLPHMQSHLSVFLSGREGILSFFREERFPDCDPASTWFALPSFLSSPSLPPHTKPKAESSWLLLYDPPLQVCWSGSGGLSTVHPVSYMPQK